MDLETSGSLKSHWSSSAMTASVGLKAQSVLNPGVPGRSWDYSSSGETGRDEAFLGRMVP